ncbi:MAG: hypothetical protein AAF567_14915 [Actinomycetota bacterium]
MTGFDDQSEFAEIYGGLGAAAVDVYSALKAEYGLWSRETHNAAGDGQIELDAYADSSFLQSLATCASVRYVISEERPDLVAVNDGRFSVALDPLDGSKSALVGIPSGAIFGIFEDVQQADDFDGRSIRASGFFVFGLNLEVFYADSRGVYRAVYQGTNGWTVTPVPPVLPSSSFFAINTSNQYYWDAWLRRYYNSLVEVDDGNPTNLRWYASMVSEVKRLILQGGVFSYPRDSRAGYENGRLRHIYEALPMAFLVERLGGGSFDGTGSLLDRRPKSPHERVQVFLGEAEKIQNLAAASLADRNSGS